MLTRVRIASAICALALLLAQSVSIGQILVNPNYVITNASVTVGWDDPNPPSDNVVQYFAFIRPEGGAEQVITVDAPNTTAQFNALRMGINHYISVGAMSVDQQGASRYSERSVTLTARLPVWNEVTAIDVAGTKVPVALSDAQKAFFQGGVSLRSNWLSLGSGRPSLIVLTTGKAGLNEGGHLWLMAPVGDPVSAYVPLTNLAQIGGVDKPIPASGIIVPSPATAPSYNANGGGLWVSTAYLESNLPQVMAIGRDEGGGGAVDIIRLCLTVSAPQCPTTGFRAAGRITLPDPANPLAPYSQYIQRHGATYPALGTLYASTKRQLAIGLGTFPGGQGNKLLIMEYNPATQGWTPYRNSSGYYTVPNLPAPNANYRVNNGKVVPFFASFKTAPAGQSPLDQLGVAFGAGSGSWIYFAEHSASGLRPFVYPGLSSGFTSPPADSFTTQYKQVAGDTWGSCAAYASAANANVCLISFPGESPGGNGRARWINRQSMTWGSTFVLGGTTAVPPFTAVYGVVPR